ncbi:hypothetical protein B0H11DRAFT_2225972 [Mycena galericulata]|nr:hypothetical protein B0H11DRAFT_2225972 [Mycena galericulata]
MTVTEARVIFDLSTLLRGPRGTPNRTPEIGSGTNTQRVVRAQLQSDSPGITPKPTPLAPPTVKDIQQRVGGHTSRPLLIEANEKAKNNGIRDADTARHYLVESHWLAKDAPFTRADLFAVLLKISLLPQTLQKSMSDTLRALAFMAEVIDASVAQEVADCCAESVAKAVAPYIDGMIPESRRIAARDDVHVAWRNRNFFGLALLECTVPYGSPSNPACLAIRHLWRAWKNAELITSTAAPDGMNDG